MRTNLQYRVLKYAWGIAIDIEAGHFEIIQNNMKEEAKMLLKNKHKLRVHTHLLSEEIAMIQKGLNLAIPHLKTDKTFLIQVYKVEFNECHFQLEGLAAAFYKWAIQHFAIENLQELSYSYDKNSNKYIFENL